MSLQIRCTSTAYAHFRCNFVVNPPSLRTETPSAAVWAKPSWIVCIYATPGALRAPGVLYIESVLFYSSLHIHHQIVHTSHFSIFSRPKPGGGVYLWGPDICVLENTPQKQSDQPNVFPLQFIEFLQRLTEVIKQHSGVLEIY